MGRLLTTRQRRQLIRLAISLIVAGVLFVAQRYGWIEPASNQAMQVQPGLYRVLRAEDGDTLTVDMNGVQERVRLIGVDTPETQDPRVPVQCFGVAASDFTKNLVGYGPVRLEADPTNQNRDRYNRLLRYVYLSDGRLVNAEIIRAGYGFAYTLFPFEKMEEFRRLELDAREQLRGLWSSCDINETDGKKTTNPA